EASRAEPTELRVCGGGAANPVWLQMIADVTGVGVSRSTDTENGARGAFWSAWSRQAVPPTSRRSHLGMSRSATASTQTPPAPASTRSYSRTSSACVRRRRRRGPGWPRCGNVLPR
ncbi:MAG: hypothetical protein H0V07_10210, partial [Propionibacteriales bacterium]|nr:hypothetical protein [Propionibacteriales bacterium]